MDPTRLQIAVQVRDLDEARHFYRAALGYLETHSDARRLDFDLYGHQLVCHLDPQLGKLGRVVSNYTPVGGQGVRVAHSGVALATEEWNALIKRLKQRRAAFFISYVIRVDSAPGERATLFLVDPSGNAIDFKLFHNIAQPLLRRKGRARLMG
jgi:extradiol dioxygenase family protein